MIVVYIVVGVSVVFVYIGVVVGVVVSVVVIVVVIVVVSVVIGKLFIPGKKKDKQENNSNFSIFIYINGIYLYIF